MNHLYVCENCNLFFGTPFLSVCAGGEDEGSQVRRRGFPQRRPPRLPPLHPVTNLSFSRSFTFSFFELPLHHSPRCRAERTRNLMLLLKQIHFWGGSVNVGSVVEFHRSIYSHNSFMKLNENMCIQMKYVLMVTGSFKCIVLLQTHLKKQNKHKLKEKMLYISKINVFSVVTPLSLTCVVCTFVCRHRGNLFWIKLMCGRET